MDHHLSQDFIDRLEGSTTSSIGFGQLTMDFTMRVPSFIGTCLSAVTDDLSRHFALQKLRGQGTALILHTFEVEPGVEALAVGRPLEETHTAQLFRVPAEGGATAERLVVDERFDLHGYARVGSGQSLGFDNGSGPRVNAGHVRMLQIFTRPLAAAGARQVTAVPPEFRRLREHPWAGPFPSLERLAAESPGFAALDVQPPAGNFAVWGVGNTDTNQHVTVTEYLMALENRFYLLMSLAGLPLREHRVTRARCLFRKPFFPGLRYTVQGRLFRDGRRTRMHGGIYEVDTAGAAAPRPSVFGCYEGEITLPGA